MPMDSFSSEGILRRLIRLPYLPLYVGVLNAAVELDVFSDLTQRKSVRELSEERGWNEDNTRYFLDALYCLGFIWKRDEMYCNCRETDRYLVKGRPEYIGGHLAFHCAEDCMGCRDIKRLVEEGPGGVSQPEGQPAFEQYVQNMRESQMGFRQTEIQKMVTELPEYLGIRKILDLGCATGLLGLGVMGEREDMYGILYDRPAMEPAIRESIRLTGLNERATPMTGDYLTDDIGDGYDLILAIATLSFVEHELAGLMRKLYKALNPGGVLLCYSEGIERDGSGPWDMVLGWLPYNMQGYDLGVKKNEVTEAAMAAGFSSAEKRTGIYSTGNVDVDIFRK